MSHELAAFKVLAAQQISLFILRGQVFIIGMNYIKPPIICMTVKFNASY